MIESIEVVPDRATPCTQMGRASSEGSQLFRCAWLELCEGARNLLMRLLALANRVFRMMTPVGQESVEYLLVEIT